MIDGQRLDFDYNRYKAQTLLGAHTATEQLFIDIPRETSVKPSKDSVNEMWIDVVKKLIKKSCSWRWWKIR